jgi:NADPH:quinone reductase-like Zn-dependent oxidoreductase
LRDLGVRDIVHYDKEDVNAKVKNADVVINTVTAQNDAGIAYVKKGGMVFSTSGMPNAAKCAAAGVRCDETKGAITEGPGVQMSELISLAEAGRYRIYVEKVFPFEKTADAQEANRAGHATGKIVVAVAPQSSRR